MYQRFGLIMYNNTVFPKLNDGTNAILEEEKKRERITKTRIKRKSVNSENASAFHSGKHLCV